jgi:hypothetical protein
MTALLLALGAFASLILTHILVWRLHRPTGQYATLSLLWLLVLVAVLAALHVVPSAIPGSPGFRPLTPTEYVNFLMLYTALMLPYVTTYSAVQADSPAMAILLRMDAVGSHGLTIDEMLDQLGDDVLVIPRLNDLVKGKLLIFHRGRYVIRRRGALLARLHLGYRRLLQMEKGG